MDIPTRVMLAGRELISTKGLVNWTVDDLAKQSGISKRTLYKYFSSKDEIIETILNDFMLEMQSNVDKIIANESDPKQIIQSIISQLFVHAHFIINPSGLEDLRTSYPHLWQKIDDFRSDRLREIIKHLITLDENDILMEIDEKILVTVIITAIKSVLNPTFIIENNLKFDETLNHLAKLLLKILS